MASQIQTSAGFKPAQREHTSLLAAAEKRALIWIAERLPRSVNSDHLTAAGFIALIFAGGAYWYSREHKWALIAVIGLLALNWFGDSLDGTVARVRNRQRPRYGFYLDHLLDAIGISILLSGLAFSGLMTPWVAYLFLIVYLLLSIEIYLATYAIGKFHLSHWNFGPTELRILLVIGNLFAMRRADFILAGHQFLLFDAGFLIGALVTALILLQVSIRHTGQLYREETLEKIP